jgi:hypothetical protein
VCMGKSCILLLILPMSITIPFIPTGPWSEHGTSWYTCNRYDEKSSSAARDNQTQSRASLERYLHVCLLL